MKTVFYLILSLVLAAGFCLLLVATGLLKFKDNGLVAELKPMGEKVLSDATTAFDFLPTVNNDTSPLDSQKTSSLPPPAGQDSAVPATASAPMPNPLPAADRESLIHTKALEFLSVRAGKGEADIEDQFAKFLMQELDVDRKETARLVRMSFWKNFVTLQHQWRADESDQMWLAFEREKKLKQAGFAAKGLTLMASEAQEAEACLQKLRQKWSEAPQEGEKL